MSLLVGNLESISRVLGQSCQNIQTCLNSSEQTRLRCSYKETLQYIEGISVELYKLDANLSESNCKVSIIYKYFEMCAVICQDCEILMNTLHEHEDLLEMEGPWRQTIKTSLDTNRSYCDSLLELIGELADRLEYSGSERNRVLNEANHLQTCFNDAIRALDERNTRGIIDNLKIAVDTAKRLLCLRYTIL